MDKYGQYSSTEVSLFRGALDYFRAAELVLKGSPPILAHPLGMLMAHSLELTLKAFLLSVGLTDDDLRREIGHDLTKAWKVSVANGLPIAQDPPYWCTTLNSAHNVPYHFRYAKVNTGLVLPPPKQIVVDLENTLKVVGEKLGLDMVGNFVN